MDLPHPSTFSAALTGQSGKEYPVRYDFDAAFRIEAMLNGTPPQVLATMMSSAMLSLANALVVLQVGMDCHRRHVKGTKPVGADTAKNALQDVGLRQLCEELSAPLLAVARFDLLEEDEEEAAEAVDPPIGTPTG